MKILVIGNGSREHALCFKLAESKHSKKIYVAPGNVGTETISTKINNVNILANDIKQLVKFAKIEKIDLTVVGSEEPLSLGIVDLFKKENLICLGPSLICSQIESSKVFSKNFMNQYNIPTAKYKVFTDAYLAKEYVKTFNNKTLVIKANGLFAGKGVIIIQNYLEACQVIDNMLIKNKFGKAGEEIIIEEYLKGTEVSCIVLSDGKNFVSMANSKDYKNRDDNNIGPNTGGMGAYSSNDIISKDLHKKIIDNIIRPVIDNMALNYSPYKGFLYAGVMITDDNKVKALEYNCRLGDPETVPIMMRLDSDILELFMASINCKLDKFNIKWNVKPAVAVVMSSGGYPLSYKIGKKIVGLDNIDKKDAMIFHAGTTFKNNDIITNGGRVLCVSSLGEDINSARNKVYKTVNKIHWEDEYHRTDIALN